MEGDPLDRDPSLDRDYPLWRETPGTEGSFTPRDSVTITITFDGQNGYVTHSARQRSMVPPINVTVTVTESLGVNEPSHLVVGTHPTGIHSFFSFFFVKT